MSSSLMSEFSFEDTLRVTTNFYDKAKNDFMIGYHFRVIDDFDQHIPRIARFWFLQLNGKFYQDQKEMYQVLPKHMPLGIKKGEVGRWVTLFKETLESEDSELCSKWMNRIENFQKIFLNSPQLYSS